jgi:hypothetical protein
MEVSGQLHTLAALCHGVRAPGTHWTGGLGGPQSWSGCGGDKKKSHHCFCWELNPGHAAYSLVTILLQLLWKLNPFKKCRTILQDTNKISKKKKSECVEACCHMNIPNIIFMTVVDITLDTDHTNYSTNFLKMISIIYTICSIFSVKLNVLVGSP